MEQAFSAVVATRKSFKLSLEKDEKGLNEGASLVYLSAATVGVVL